MKCDLCDSPAVVHEVNVRDGVKNEVHLCEEHARAAGITLPGSAPIKQLLSPHALSKSTPKKTRAAGRCCSTCGMPYAEFRQSGVLGCADCYASFEKQLSPMIERAQNGGTCHSGKCPRRGNTSIDRSHRLQRLMKDLDDAVAAEQYERAAELRDELRDLELQVAVTDASMAKPIVPGSTGTTHAERPARDA